MLTWSTLVPFVLAAGALLLVPGPAVLYIVTRSIDQGRTAGLMSAAGIAVGNLAHITATTLGLSTVLASSATAFSVVKYVGAAYLVWIGVQTLRGASGKESGVASPARSHRHVFAQGIMVNVLNPKAALFYLAFLPQFVDPDKGPIVTQTLLLGGIFSIMAICNDVCYALLAGRLGTWLRVNAGFLRRQRYITGSVYVMLGVLTAMTGSRKS